MVETGLLEIGLGVHRIRMSSCSFLSQSVGLLISRDSHIAMERSLEQRYAIKVCVRLGKNATETFQMLQKAFKDDCISRSQSGKWHKAFKEGGEEVADEPRSGRPTTARTDSKFCVPTVD
ncbi:hypothetical protein LAZ67_20001597 [Cordylochernes scorpioides]|uniref:Mos1 transposase HTH domain-containing protein n=1 Tax=Cordylochernes scorpioides TaxID=51811 RepID=A0ABY6LP02_9ARAC|nr:hypothetical protein LAZ67_20001597 [Cordylochernes scorpioides]